MKMFSLNRKARSRVGGGEGRVRGKHQVEEEVEEERSSPAIPKDMIVGRIWKKPCF
jgi:hypothetical protein